MKKPKPKRRRTPAHKVNQRQRAAAIKALEKIVADPNAPTHAVAASARALLNDGRPSSEDEANAKAGEADARFVFLPSNGRETDLGKTVYPTLEAAREAAEAGEKSGIFIYDTPDSSRHRAEHIARLERRRGRTEMLALPAPIEP